MSEVVQRLRPVAAAGALFAALAAIAIGVGVGYAPRIGLLALALVVVGNVCVWAIQRPWGALVVMAPVVLLPRAPDVAGLGRPLTMAVVLLPLATTWWASGAGRPRLSRWTIGAVGAISLASIVATVGADGPLLDSLAQPLLWTSGVLFGTSVARSPLALRASLWFVGASAVFAIAQSAGLQNYALKFNHAAGYDYIQMASRAGASRALGTFGHPLVAGTMFATFALLAAGAGVFTRPLIRWFLVAALVGGAVATVSRSAVLGLLVGTTSMAIFAARNRRQAIGVLAIGIAMAALLASNAVPSLHASVEARFGSSSAAQQPVRALAVGTLDNDLRRSNPILLYGGGTSYVQHRLATTGSVDGYLIFDNQYITSLYETGAFGLGVGLLLFAIALWRADPVCRQIGVPPLLAIATGMAFVDGLGWVALAFTVSSVAGFASSPRRQLSPPAARQTAGPPVTANRS